MKATEITQDTFVWLLHNPDRFDPNRGSISSFLIGVSRKLLQQQFQIQRRWVQLDESIHSGSTASSYIEDSEKIVLRRAIAALPPRYREVVALCDLDDYSYEEAARALECATGTVRSRLHRARLLLARKLGSKKTTLGCSV